MSQIRTNSIVPSGGVPAGADGGGIIQVVENNTTDYISMRDLPANTTNPAKPVWPTKP